MVNPLKHQFGILLPFANMTQLYNGPPTFVYMVWITPQFDQMVRFSGNIFDIRKRHMLPSFFCGQGKIPR
ncbi:MAG: hypothetical protein ACK55Z_35345, partial [bacterium]